MTARSSLPGPLRVVCVVVLLLLGIGARGARGLQLGSFYDSLVAADPTVIFGSAVLVNMSSTGPQLTPDDAVAFRRAGLVGTTSTMPAPRSIAFGVNTLSEMWTVLVALHLAKNGLLHLHASIPNLWLPAALSSSPSLINPAFPTVPITIQHLMTHTSTLTEVGFASGYNTTPGSVGTLDEFVEDLFHVYGDEIFSTSTAPGDGATFRFSRTNIALLGYIINKVIAATEPGGIGAYMFTNIIQPLGMFNTFVLDRHGQLGNRPYPEGITYDWLPEISLQDLSDDGTSVVNTRRITAAFIADCMFYTTTSDLFYLLQGLFLPKGLFTHTLGKQLRANAVAVNDAALPYVTHRANGLYLFNITRLCEEMAVDPHAATPPCSFPPGTPSYGLMASGPFNQVALVCVEGTSSSCSGASVSYYHHADRMFNSSVYIRNYALSLSLASITSAMDAGTADGGIQGIFVFTGVFATIVVVLLSSYIADYLIQPAPPLNVIVPVPRPVEDDSPHASAGCNDDWSRMLTPDGRCHFGGGGVGAASSSGPPNDLAAMVNHSRQLSTPPLPGQTASVEDPYVDTDGFRSASTFSEDDQQFPPLSGQSSVPRFDVYI